MSSVPTRSDRPRLFPLRMDDIWWVEQTTDLVRRLIARPSLSAHQIHDLSMLLFGLERLPRATGGLSIEFGISDQTDDAMRYCGLSLSDANITLDHGGSDYDPQIGSDSHSHTCFEAEIGRGRFMDDASIHFWVERFQSYVEQTNTEVSITNDTDSIDWSAGPVATDWDDVEAKNG